MMSPDKWPAGVYWTKSHLRDTRRHPNAIGVNGDLE
jgi:hypothetical protein